jgi:hypothetical protein
VADRFIGPSRSDVVDVTIPAMLCRCVTARARIDAINQFPVPSTQWGSPIRQ